MSMLNTLEKAIASLNLMEGNIPPIVTAIADAIPSRTIPYRMKLALAMSEIVLYASQFRINIKHWNGSEIPINSIMFCVAKSGAAKDSSLNSARKCFNAGYEILNEYRKKSAIDRAIKEATEAGYENPTTFRGYKDFYNPPNPLFVAISTPEGFIKHLNDLSKDDIGAGYIFTGEIGAELANNPNVIENIKILAELYDEGNKQRKAVKAKENQSDEVHNFPASAVFIGSQDNLLFNEEIKKIFKTEFTSKLARRSFFVFVHEDMQDISYESIEDMLATEKRIEDNAILQRNEVSKFIVDLTDDLLKYPSKTIKVSDEVRDLFTLYKKYNEEVSATIDSSFPIAKLTRAHLQWKAFKLAGALALMECSEFIELEHYRAAIEFVELINNDVTVFEKELVKEPYELFASYAKTYAYNGEYTINLHNLRKNGFIPTRGQSSTAMKELVKLVNSYDELGTYTYNDKDDTITYKEIKKTNKIILSYLECTGTKEQRARRCVDGYQFEECEFSDLYNMLEGDYAYSPFKFVNGVRGKENIISGCKWIVLDIDSSEITDEEAHILLSDINHYVVRSSNKSNANKFRVLIELDAEVDIPDIKWKAFIEAISTDLGLTADGLPKSQIFFSYKDRNILSVLDASPLETKQYLSAISTVSVTRPKKPTKSSCNIMLADPMTTFDKAFNARDGEGRRKIIWALRYARELGADRDYCHNLLDQIVDYWVHPLPNQDVEAIHRQLDRWNFVES